MWTHVCVRVRVRVPSIVNSCVYTIWSPLACGLGGRIYLFVLCRSDVVKDKAKQKAIEGAWIRVEGFAGESFHPLGLRSSFFWLRFPPTPVVEGAPPCAGVACTLDCGVVHGGVPRLPDSLWLRSMQLPLHLGS